MHHLLPWSCRDVRASECATNSVLVLLTMRRVLYMKPPSPLFLSAVQGVPSLSSVYLLRYTESLRTGSRGGSGKRGDAEVLCKMSRVLFVGYFELYRRLLCFLMYVFMKKQYEGFK